LEEEAMAHYDRILHATDYSKASARALAEAVALTKQNRAELLVLHVIDPVTPYAVGDDIGGAELYLKLEETAKQEAQTSMKKLVDKLQKLRVRAKSILVRGSAHEQIVKTAKNRRANLIVIGTHGRTGLSRLLMGSVANQVVSTAHCPVLTVRGK
jgi:universal stress protein A